MFIHRRKPWDPVGGTETPSEVALHRRRWLTRTGLGIAALATGTAGFAGYRYWRGTDDEVVRLGSVPQSDRNLFPVPRDPRFTYGRPETDRTAAARYTNFYEFSSFKWVWRYVDRFQPEPWQLRVDGLCARPRTWTVEELHAEYRDDLCERQYRHRCVERWAMAIPWSGIPLAKLLQDVEPLAQATHVRFVSFLRPDEAPHQVHTEYPWPYTEGLTLAEATHDLTFVATGMYGQPLLKQHGAPLRLVVPWKYGYKSIKSIERIELIDHRPATFWNTLNPEAYPFESNVDPEIPRPWPQFQERMLGTDEPYPTQLYNGYAEYVAGLYAAA